MAPRHPVPNTASVVRRSTLALLAFWLVVAALLYAGFSWHESRVRAALKPYVDANGALVIPRSPDGHFYVRGEVNHVPVRFLVDTGASSVAVSDALAETAMLPPGSPVTVSTAGGVRTARLVRDVPVKVGPLSSNETTVTTGLDLGAPDEALLGQSFLRHFDVRIDGQRMLLRSR